jgi:mRNA-degrading endonuclease RelE of RelBE toxin-antitoxin system
MRFSASLTVTEQQSKRLSILWSEEARADLRGIERQLALDILRCIDRFSSSHTGDIKKLKPPLTGYRLRCGEYRVFFDRSGEFSIHILAVRNRKDAYR